MDLVASGSRVIVTMEHTDKKGGPPPLTPHPTEALRPARPQALSEPTFSSGHPARPAGNPKILQNCSLPLTGMRVVNKVITEKAVFEVLPDGNGLQLQEIGDGETVESLRAATGAEFTVVDGLVPMRQS